MSEPKRPGKYAGHGTFVGYLCGEADAYMDHIEAELNQLRTERDRLLSETWRVPRDQWPAKADGYYMVRRWTRWHCGGNAIFREDITKLAEVAALTQREGGEA